jgi:hypothetical protein
VARAQGFTEPYKYQEYPKHLYKDGVREVHPVSGEQVSGDERVVKGKAEEDAARKAGFRMLGEPAPEEEKQAMRKPRTPPRGSPRRRTANNALCRPPTT